MINISKLQEDLTPEELLAYPKFDKKNKFLSVPEFIYAKLVRFAQMYIHLGDEKPMWDDIQSMYDASNSDLSDTKRTYVREWVCSFIEDIEFVKDVVMFKMAGNYLGNVCLKFIATLPFIFCMDNTN